MVGIYIALPITIILFWQSVGDAFGYRFLFCLFPIALLGYVFWHKTLKEKYKTYRNYPWPAKQLQIVILLMCCYGLLGNIFFGVNSDLMYKPGIANSFGKEGGSAVGYNIAVLKSTPKVSTWINLIATRTPGFFVAGVLDMFSVNLKNLNLPSALSEKLDKFYCCYQHPPFQSYVQALLIGLLFIGSYVLLIKKDYAK